MKSNIPERLPLVVLVVNPLLHLLVVQPGHPSPLGRDDREEVAEKEKVQDQLVEEIQT